MKDLIFKTYQMCDRKTRDQFVKLCLDLSDENVLSNLCHFLFSVTDYNRLKRTFVHRGGKDI